MLVESDLERAVSGVLVFTGVCLQRMRRFGVRNTFGAGLGARLCAGPFPFLIDLQPALAPGRQRQGQKPFIDAVGDRVDQAGTMLPDDEHDHPQVLLRHEGDLRVKATQRPTVVGK